MVPWFARLLLVSAGLSLILVLAGCAQVDLESEFESDGSARHSIVKVVDPTMFEDLEEDLEGLEEEGVPDEEALEEDVEEEVGEDLDREEIADSFDSVIVDAADAGLQFDRIDEETRIGVRFSTDADEGEDLGDVLNLLYATITEGVDEIDAFSGSFSTTEDEDGSSTSVLEVTVDGDALIHAGAFLSGTEDEDDDTLQESFVEGIQNSLEEDPEGEELREVFSLTYAVGMPGEIVDHNGTELDDGRILLNLPFQGTETFQIESQVVPEVEEESGFPLALTLGIGGGMLIVILIIAGGIILMRNREPAPET